MSANLSKRQLRSLIKKAVRDFEASEAGRALLAVAQNGCIAYRGPRTQPVCVNMSEDACRELDIRLKVENPNFHAVSLQKPCEATS